MSWLKRSMLSAGALYLYRAKALSIAFGGLPVTGSKQGLALPKDNVVSLNRQFHDRLKALTPQRSPRMFFQSFLGRLLESL
jgi:hypothetical protein